MDRVLGPYLRGGGAKAFKSNFQALSTDLLVRCRCVCGGGGVGGARRRLSGRGGGGGGA
jgi:hypothetical protein